MMKTFAKVTVSLLLIATLLFNVEWSEVLRQLRSMNTWLLAFVLLLMTLQFPISSWKWQKSLRIHGLDYPFGLLQKVLCIGFFFNNFLPTSIGGDAYRVIKTVPSEGYKSRALSSVLFERIVGFGALLFLGLVGGLVTLKEQQPIIVVNFVIVCLAGFAAFAVFLVMMQRGMLQGFQRRLEKIKKLEVVFHNLRHIKRGGKNLLDVVLISVGFQLMAIVIIYVLFSSVGADVGYAKCALLGAIVGIVAVLPISINGIGVVEGSFAVAAVQLGIDLNQAVIVAFLLRILVVPISLVCGLVYLWDARSS